MADLNKHLIEIYMLVGGHARVPAFGSDEALMGAITERIHDLRDRAFQASARETDVERSKRILGGKR